jgi:hypothetical protein
MVQRSRQIWYGACVVVFWLSLVSMAWTHRQFTEHSYANPPQQFIDHEHVLSFGVVPWLELVKRQQGTRSWRSWRIVAPGLIVLPLLSIAPAPLFWWLWGRFVAFGRLYGRCDHCGYQSGHSNRCSECGRIANRASITAGGESFQKHRRFLTPALLFMGACGLASLVGQIAGFIAVVRFFQGGSVVPEDTRWVFPITFAALICMIVIASFRKQNDIPQ